MRFRTHLIASALAGLVCYPCRPDRALLLTLGGVLIDLDHLALHALRSGDWSPVGALRYNRYRGRRPRPGDARPRYGSLRSILHRPALTLPLVWLAALRRPVLRPFALGLTLHLAMDSPVLLRWDRRAWRRAAGRCERCGAADRRLHVRLIRPSGPFWSLRNRAVWCTPCARAVYGALM